MVVIPVSCSLLDRVTNKTVQPQHKRVTETEGVYKLCKAYAVATITLSKECCILQHHGMPNRMLHYLDKIEMNCFLQKDNINCLKKSKNYMYHLLYHLKILHFTDTVHLFIYLFRTILRSKPIICLKKTT